MRAAKTIATLALLAAALATAQVVPTDEEVTVPPTTTELLISLPTPPLSSDAPTNEPNPTFTFLPNTSAEDENATSAETTLPAITDPAGSTIVDGNETIGTTAAATDKPCYGWCHVGNSAPGALTVAGAAVGALAAALGAMLV